MNNFYKLSGILLFLFLLLFNNIFTISQQNSSSKENPFTLQQSLTKSIIIIPQDDPIEVIIELNFTINSGQLYLHYFELIEDNKFSSKSIEIISGEYKKISAQVSKAAIFLNDNSSLLKNSTAEGFYRIHRGEIDEGNIWQSAFLFHSSPSSMEIFSGESGWVYNITVNTFITELIGGKLVLDYSMTDFSQQEYIENTGEFQFHINASSADLAVAVGNDQNYARVSGYYTVTNYGKVYEITSGFEYFSILVLISIVIIKPYSKR